MRKREADITARVNRWFAGIVPQSAPWEVKHTRGQATFKMRELKEHQKNYLIAATTERGFTWKIPDVGFTHPPCDSIHYKNCDAFVIVVFPLCVAAIEIRNLLRYGGSTLPEDEALAIASWSVHLNKLPK